MKKMMKTLISLVIGAILTVLMFVPASASVKQSENTEVRKSSDGTWRITAYAAFDRVATIKSNANIWNYTGRSTVTKAPVKGKNTLTIKTTATMKNSASITIGAGKDSAHASNTSSWQAVTAKYTVNKNVDKGKTAAVSDATNLVIQPRKYYKANTAGITVTSTFTRSDSKRAYSIHTAA